MFAVLIHGLMQLIVFGEVGKTFANIKWGCPKYQVYGLKDSARITFKYLKLKGGVGVYHLKFLCSAPVQLVS